MKYPISALFLILLFFQGHIFAQKNGLVIHDINIIDVIKGKSQKADILIQDGKIKRISKKIKSNPSYTKVDGSGKWLSPGLVDAHIHLFQSGGIYTRPDAIDLSEFRSYDEERQWLKDNASDLLKRYLRCGITTVIDVGGPLYNFEIRDTYNDPTQFPNLFLTGPLVSTYQPAAFDIEDAPILKVKSKEEAIALVQKQLPYKPDFIKIWYITLPSQSAESTYDIVKATIDESHKNGLKVAVHATQLNTAKLAIKAGADILVHSVDAPIDEDFITMLTKNKVIYIPTLVVHGNYTKTFSQDISLSDEDFAFSNPFPLGSLFDSKHLPEGNPFESFSYYLPQMKENSVKTHKIRLANLKMLSEKAITISTGTDAGNIGTLHASSYYEEIDSMKASGMSDAQILTASTINGAKVLGKENELGSIEEGKLADLLILNSNPLDNINAIKDIDFVIKGGNLLSKDSIIIETPEALVQQQLNGYNARNIDAFLAPYSDDVEIYNFPDELRNKGKDKIKPGYQKFFDRCPDLHCELVNRTVLGNTVIDHERITGIPNMEYLEAVAIYKIKDGKIAQVYFISK